MSDIYRSLVRFVPFSGGTTAFVVNTVPSGFSSPFQLGAIDGKTYHYWAVSADGTQFENGAGVYTAATQTLTRVTISSSSAQIVGVAAAVSFTAPPTVDVLGNWTNVLTAEYANLPPATVNTVLTLPISPIPSGTLMLFQQSAAPSGWTKQTTHNDKALRVVSGATSSGGSNAFSTVMAQTVVGSTTISIGTMPSHQHQIDAVVAGGCCPGGLSGVEYTSIGVALQTTFDDANGGGGSHNHPILLDVLYVDLIICQKN
jgi:hypothetical protein